MILVLGIDPGANGSCVALSDDMNFKTFPFSRTHSLFLALSKLPKSEIISVYIEKVGAMPQDSRQSCHTFGRNTGVWEGLLLALNLPYTEVSPTTWMSALRCLTKGDKRVSLDRSKQLFPKHAKEITHNNADALLIACYGMVQWKKSILET